MRQQLQKAHWFVKEVWAELTWKNRPLPDPPGYVPKPTFVSLPWRRKAEVLQRAWHKYLLTWRSQEDMEAERQAMLRAAMQEQKAAVQDLLGQAKGAAKDAEQPLQSYVQEWVATYQKTLQQFVLGYREGRQEPPQTEQPTASAQPQPPPDNSPSAREDTATQGSAAAPPPREAASIDDKRPKPPR